MTKLYMVDCSPLYNEQELNRVLPYLSPSRREKVERLQVAEKKAQSVAAGLLLRHLFGDVEYVYGENGKPYLAGENVPFFSLSHSGKYVVCGVSDYEIGVDVEAVSPIRLAVLRRCFTEEEQNWIGDDPKRFTWLWTMKEAYIKMTGTGLSVPAKEVSVPFVECADLGNVYFHSFWEGSFAISICGGRKANEYIEKIYLDLNQLL